MSVEGVLVYKEVYRAEKADSISCSVCKVVKEKQKINALLNSITQKSHGLNKHIFKRVDVGVSWSHISSVMRKPAFCICKNKGADQLHGNSAADQPFVFAS